MNKKIFLVIMALGSTLLIGGETSKLLLENSRTPRKISVGGNIKIELTHGMNNLEIVLPENSYKSTAFAASELKKYLSRQLGIDVPVATKPNEGKISFILGINDLSNKAGIKSNIIDRDGYIIKTIGNKIYILGKDDPKRDTSLAVDEKRGGGGAGLWHERGTLFGVYEFLERFCKVRFYHANDLFTIVPEQKKIAIPEIDIYDRPDFEIRNYSATSGRLEDNSKKSGWSKSVFFAPSKALNYIRFRAQTYNIPCVHGLSHLFFIERFAKSNPEYFALHANGRRYSDKSMPHSGQLCFSSKVMDEIFEDAKAILSGDMAKIKARSPLFYNKYNGFKKIFAHTPGVVFNFMTQDGFYHCRCEKCLPHMKSPQALSNFIWSKAAEIAKRLQDAGVKGYVTTMAYYPCHLLPENVDLPENVLIMVAQNGPWAPSDIQAKDMKFVQEWNRRSKKNKVWMWNYICKVSSRNLTLPGIPCNTPRAMGNYLKSMSGKINGSFMESGFGYPQDHYFMQALSYYVFGKLSWNNSTDVDALLKEHYTLCYGAAAQEIATITEQIEKLWLTKVTGKSIMNNLGPVNTPPSDNQLWNEIYNDKQISEFENLIKQAQGKLKNDPLALARVNYFADALIKPLREQFIIYKHRTDSISKFRVGIDENTPATVYLQPLKPKGNPFVETKVTIREMGDKIQFSFECQEPEMAKVLAKKHDKDNIGVWQDNDVELVINPSGDLTNYFHIAVNSKGSIYDSKCLKVGSKSQHDPTWDSKCEAKVSTTKDGWKAVLTIDKANLGKWNYQGIPVNFSRHRLLSGVDELFTWSPFLVNGFHELERFGRIIPAKNIAENVVQNGGFSAKNWQHWGGWWHKGEHQTRKLDLQNFIFSNKSVKIAYRGNNPKTIVGINQVLLKIKPGKKYRINFFLKLDNVIPLSRNGGVCLQIWNTSKNFWFPKTRLKGTMPWTLQTFEFETLPNSNPKSTYMNCLLTSATGTAWFDGFFVEEI